MRPERTQAGTNFIIFAVVYMRPGPKRFVDNMRPVQTQKQEILVAI